MDRKARLGAMTATDQLHLNAAAGLLQIGEPLDAWQELEMIAPLNRAKTEVLTVRLAVCRALKDWGLAEDIARKLIRREPHNVMHVVALAEVMGKREGPVAAAAVYEFAIDRFSDFAPLRVSLAVELVKAGQIEDAKRTVKKACEMDPDLRLVVLDHLGLEAIWWPYQDASFTSIFTNDLKKLVSNLSRDGGAFFGMVLQRPRR
jgi:tetratricopeptide (TPR) repeat protein